MKWLFILAGVILLGACAQTGQPSRVGQAVNRAQELILSDVEQALALAERAGDQLAVRCWSYLRTRVANRPEVPSVEGAEFRGALTVYQAGRNVRRTLSGTVSDAFRIACGPMVMESKAALRRLGIGALSPL